MHRSVEPKPIFPFADFPGNKVCFCFGPLQNPGFDFSQAQFNGGCPDPRTFMGGIRSD